MESLFRLALELARTTYSHFESNRYPTRLTDVMFRGVTDDTAFWKPIRESKQFRSLFELARKETKFSRDEVLLILHEYVYDVAVNLHKWKNLDVEHELTMRARLVASDLVTQLPAYIALSPVFGLLGSIESVSFDDCTLRRAAYTERIWYKPSYPLLVHAYGPEGFEYLIEIDRSNVLKEIGEGLGDLYMQICARVVTAIRLVYGGTAGLQFLTARNHFERLDFGKSREPGTVYPLHYISHGVEHIWQPGKLISILETSRVDALRLVVQALESVNRSELAFVWRAIRRFCGSVGSGQSLDDSILDLTIAYESLFGQNKTEAARRAATLLSFDDGYSSSLARDLEILWSARNALAHGESVAEAESRVNGSLSGKATLAFRALRVCLLETISLKPTNPESLRKILDEASKGQIQKAELYHDVPHEILDMAREGILNIMKLIEK